MSPIKKTCSDLSGAETSGSLLDHLDWKAARVLRCTDVHLKTGVAIWLFKSV